MKDLTGIIIGDVVSPTEWNHERDEAQGLVTSTGIALSAADAAQVRKAVAAYSGAGDFYTAGGTTSAITLAIVPSLQAPSALRDGLRARFRPTGRSIAGGTTINVAGLGVKNLVRRDGSALLGSDLNTDLVAEIAYDIGTGAFIHVSHPGRSHLNELYDKNVGESQGPNLIDNPSFMVWQHTTKRLAINTLLVTSACTTPGGTTEDYDIPIDRWHIISEVDDAVTVQPKVGAADGDGALLDMTVAITGSKFGILQNIESMNLLPVVAASSNNTVSLGFNVHNARAGSVKISAAVIEWTGTADELPLTPVSAWNADDTAVTFAATSNTQAAQSTFTVAGTTRTRLFLENIPVASTAKNLRVAIWMNDATGNIVGDKINLSNIKLEVGFKSTPFEFPRYSDDLLACQRHYQRFGAQDSDGSTNANKIVLGWGGHTNSSPNTVIFSVPMHAPFLTEVENATFAISALADFIDWNYSATVPSARTVSALVLATEFRHGTNMFSLQATVSAGGADQNAVLSAGAVADGDTLFPAGIHIRSKM